MKTLNQAVRAAALAAVVAAVAVAMAAPAQASLRDQDWGGLMMKLGFGRARLASASHSGGTYAARQAGVRLSMVRPLRNWDGPNVLPAPVATIVGDF